MFVSCSYFIHACEAAAGHKHCCKPCAGGWEGGWGCASFTGCAVHVTLLVPCVRSSSDLQSMHGVGGSSACVASALFTAWEAETQYKHCCKPHPRRVCGPLVVVCAGAGAGAGLTGPCMHHCWTHVHCSTHVVHVIWHGSTSVSFVPLTHIWCSQLHETSTDASHIPGMHACMCVLGCVCVWGGASFTGCTVHAALLVPCCCSSAVRQSSGRGGTSVSCGDQQQWVLVQQHHVLVQSVAQNKH